MALVGAEPGAGQSALPSLPDTRGPPKRAEQVVEAAASAASVTGADPVDDGNCERKRQCTAPDPHEPIYRTFFCGLRGHSIKERWQNV